MAFSASLVMSVGAFWAVLHFGVFDHESVSSPSHVIPETAGTPAFVPIDPMTVSLEHGQKTHHLRFKAELDVPQGARNEVVAMMPRIVDVLNTFLRALSLEDIKHPSALTKIRSQMLRRVKIVLGDHRVNDILVMEFVVN
ncbi:flagellar basal body-associated FliL family protein [Rhodobacteraceae bacterium]|nr:flagellar basal body-associated FliL family protein [Paracoccaceae bacterium]